MPVCFGPARGLRRTRPEVIYGERSTHIGSKDRPFAGEGEWLVKEVDYGRGEAEAVDDFADECGSKGLLCGEGGGDAPLAAEDEIDGGIVGEEAFGGAGKRLAVGGLHALEQARRGEELSELGMAASAGVGEVPAYGEELIALGHVDAGGDGDFGRVNVEVEAGPGGFLETISGPPGSGVSFVGALVFGEADVAVDAHHDLLRWPDVFGGEGEHGLANLADDGEHGGFELAFIGGATLLEPGAVIVALEPAKEGEGGFGEVRGHGFDGKGIACSVAIRGLWRGWCLGA